MNRKIQAVAQDRPELRPSRPDEARGESASAPSPVAPAARFVTIAGEAGVRVVLEGGRNIVLLAQAGAGDHYEAMVRRLCGDRTVAADLAAENPGRHEPLASGWYRVPFSLLAPSWRGRALRALFPADEPCASGWVHRPGGSPVDTYGEGTWEAAYWFTGDGRHFEPILRANALSDPILRRGAEITIPADLLLDPFKAAFDAWMALNGPTVSRAQRDGSVARPGAHGRQAPIPPPPGVTTGRTPTRSSEGSAHAEPDAKSDADSGADADAESDGEPDAEPDAASDSQRRSGPSEEMPDETLSRRTDLGFGKDDEGPYASYRLKRGEALYSAVVVRFTGRLDPDEVSEAAALIAKRSGIHDVTGIPVGYAVKIPRAMLLPEFLPPDDHRRKEVEADRKATAKVKNLVRSRNLEGIHVILDAGHGGVDPGAIVGGLAEHEYVYDVMCRIKRVLETTTSATVHPTIEEPALGFVPRAEKRLRPSGGGRILTNPWHVNGDPGETSLGVNLRWYLANSIARRIVAAGSDPARSVFASIHADVLHPSLRGAMVYVPGERYRRGSFSCRDDDCDRYAEVREAPTIKFTRPERLRSEGLSRQFASRLIAAFRKRNVAVHTEQPVRDRIIRRGRDWLPAVLRGNSVPVKVLLEIANLNNSLDRARLQDAAFRQSIAESFVDALLDYYAPSQSPPARTASRTTARTVERGQVHR